MSFSWNYEAICCQWQGTAVNVYFLCKVYWPYTPTVKSFWSCLEPELVDRLGKKELQVGVNPPGLQLLWYFVYMCIWNCDIWLTDHNLLYSHSTSSCFIGAKWLWKSSTFFPVTEELLWQVVKKTWKTSSMLFICANPASPKNLATGWMCNRKVFERKSAFRL